MATKPRKYPPAKLEKQRKLWALEFGNCFLCGHQVVHNPTGFTTIAAHVHHIAGRGIAPGRYEHLSNVIVACHVCHIEIAHDHGGNWWATCLAAKQRCDPDHYDLEAWRKVVDFSGRDAVIITQDKIDGACEALRFRSFQKR